MVSGTIPTEMTLQQQSEAAMRCLQSGQLAEAERLYRQILIQAPNHPEALHMVGILAGQQARLDEAASWIRRAIAASPNNAFFYGSLGNALQEIQDIDGAIAAFRKAIALKPDLAEAYNNLGNLLRETAKADEAIACFRQAIHYRPGTSEFHSSLLVSIYSHPDYSAADILQEHLRRNNIHGQPLKKHIRPHSNDRNPHRPLNVGYVSADLRRHPVGLFMMPLLAHHDPRAVNIICYNNSRTSDEITAKLRGFCAGWRDVSSLSDHQLAEQIRSDRIDVLVDLSLHSAGNRMRVFAQKPAPVQVSWLGYPGTTGLKTMDYRLTDPYLDPAGTDDCYTERSIRLPQSYWCYQPIDPTISVNDSPAAKNGYITFACVNNPTKITSAASELWAKILFNVPHSRLLILSPPGTHRSQIMERFAAEQIDTTRVEFLERTTLLAYLQQFHRVDINLDTFPCGGGTTTCDALWMGVPTVTLRGATAVGRAGMSILSNADLKDWIAQTPDEYVRLATQMAADINGLRELRSRLRAQMEKSPLMDAARFASDIEHAIRAMWQSWAQNSA
jgi:protein O-GlcNAc transferase